jgi:hypothetical protein
VINCIPQSEVPVDVEDSGITWRVKPHHNTWAPQAIPRLEHGIIDSIQQMDEWERELLQGVEILVAPETLPHKINQPLIIASDGSVQEHQASYGWIIATQEGT